MRRVPLTKVSRLGAKYEARAVYKIKIKFMRN